MNLYEEKEKLAYRHKLEVRRQIIDRLVIGLLLGTAALTANFYFERYRGQLEEQRFFLKKRLEAVQDVRQSYAKMDENFNLLSDNTMTEINYTAYKDAIREFVDVTNRWDSLFSEDLMVLMNCHTWAHSGLSIKERSELSRYRDFVFVLSKDFDAVSRQEIGAKRAPKLLVDSCFNWTWKEADAMGASVFLDTLSSDWTP